MVISGVISRNHVRGLITPLITSLEPSSRVTKVP